MLQMVNYFKYKKNTRENSTKTTTNWKSRRCRPSSKTTSTTLNIDVTIPLKYLSRFGK